MQTTFTDLTGRTKTIPSAYIAQFSAWIDFMSDAPLSAFATSQALPQGWIGVIQKDKRLSVIHVIDDQTTLDNLIKPATHWINLGN